MTPTKLLFGQILIVFAIVLGGLWTSTQWIAAQLAYQPQLGAPWAIAFGHRVYRPWALFAWWYHFDAYAPPRSSSTAPSATPITAPAAE